MNQLTGRLGRRRKGCDVGLRVPVNAKAQVSLLHRKGTSQTDRYGADLAVTVFVDDDRFVKTAFFQLKVGDKYQVTVESQQLHEGVTNVPMSIIRRE